MRLHSSKLQYAHVYGALKAAKDAGRVANHVHFVTCTDHQSRSRARAWEIQLGTYVKDPGDKRRWKNSGDHGADSVYAATYDEWGYFIAELFQQDPDAIFGGYKGLQDFDGQTGFKYDAVSA